MVNKTDTVEVTSSNLIVPTLDVKGLHRLNFVNPFYSLATGHAGQAPTSTEKGTPSSFDGTPFSPQNN